MRPVVALQFLEGEPPVTLFKFRTVDAFQSVMAVFRYESQAPLTLSPTASVNGLAVRAQ